MATPTTTATVTKVDLPPGSLIAAVPFHDYADAFRMRVDATVFPNVDAFARSVFTRAPGWIRTAMRTRDAVVGVFGLKRTPNIETAKSDSPIGFNPGDRAGIFRVMERTDTEILLGEDDRHLDFRVSVVYSPGPTSDEADVTVSTVVRFNNAFGRAYFLPVRPAHKLIVPAMMRSAASEA